MRPAPRDMAVLVCDVSDIYLFGGWTDPLSISYKQFNDAWRYNKFTREWTSLSDRLNYPQREDGRPFPRTPTVSAWCPSSSYPAKIIVPDIDDYMPGDPLESAFRFYLLTKSDDHSVDLNFSRLDIVSQDGTLGDFQFTADFTALGDGSGEDFYLFQYERHEGDRRFFDIHHIKIVDDSGLQWRCISSGANNRMEPACAEEVDRIAKDKPISFFYRDQSNGQSFLAVIALGRGAFYEAADRGGDQATKLDQYEREVRQEKGYSLVRFSLETNSFSVVSTIPDNLHGYPLYRHGCSPVTTGRRLYLIGGLRVNPYQLPGCDLVLNEVWVLDLGEMRWTLTTGLTLPVPVYDHSATYDPTDHCIYVFGGKRMETDAELTERRGNGVRNRVPCGVLQTIRTEAAE